MHHNDKCTDTSDLDKYQPTTSDSQWQEEVRQFIMDNYHVHIVQANEIAILFNGHSLKVGSHYISYQSIRNTFGRKKDRRPPTYKMRLAFVHLKALKSSGQLLTFQDLPLKL